MVDAWADFVIAHSATFEINEAVELLPHAGGALLGEDGAHERVDMGWSWRRIQSSGFAVKWVRQRCDRGSSSTAAIASTSPPWVSEVTSCSPGEATGG